MKPEAQRIAIAEACNITNIRIERILCGDEGWQNLLMGTENGKRVIVPDYLSDLDAMHEAEKVLTEQQWDSYIHWLISVTKKWMVDYEQRCIHAAAVQRAEAFLQTLNLWKPDLSEKRDL